MSYTCRALPFHARQLPSGNWLAISASGDHTFTSALELDTVRNRPDEVGLERRAELSARFFLGRMGGLQSGTATLLASRRAAKRETNLSGPSLHILVPTLQCAHSCQYCQVSRSLSDQGHAMSPAMVDQACDMVLESRAPTLTVEFQGGDPLLRFDLVVRAIERIKARLPSERSVRFVVASTLHQLDDHMCDVLAAHDVYLSTSIDGPAALHNRNRPIPTRDSHRRTVAGIELARRRLGHDRVAALMTTTLASLSQPEEIVDEYVRLGFRDVFLRPLSSYGFAKRNQRLLGYTLEQFQAFYRRGLERVLHWNRHGVELREAYAGIVLNKMLSTFDGGYVDLQSPTGAGTGVLVYNYDGYVYPSDEARMLVETGDTSLRMGPVGDSLANILNSTVRHRLVQASSTSMVAGCDSCAYNQFCAPNPVDAQAQYGRMDVNVLETEHCRRHLWLFDMFFERLRTADPWLEDLFYDWAQPTRSERLP